MNGSRLKFVVLYFAAVGVAVHLLVPAGLLGLYRRSGLGPRPFAQAALRKAGVDSPTIRGWLEPRSVRPAGLQFPPLEDDAWAGPGARVSKRLLPQRYDAKGRPVPVEEGEKSVSDPKHRERSVSTAAEFALALKEATAGTVIVLEPGTYELHKRSIYLGSRGEAGHPAVVRARRLGEVRLRLDTLEGFYVDKPHWVFENLDIQGACTSDEACEHAFHIVGDGRSFVLRNSRVHDFNAAIKANGLPKPDGSVPFPDDALIEGNSFYNVRRRQTDNPVVFLDIVGANNWVVRGNVLADNSKGGGDQISYAAFFKGNSSGGVFERNLVVCEYSHSGGVRVGLSIGGGGTSTAASRGKSNEIEHTGGSVINNVIMYCSDVGLYLNKAKDTKVYNNTIFGTTGIDVRFKESAADIRNNIVQGRIAERDGGRASKGENLVRAGGGLSWFEKGDFSDCFANPAEGDFRVKDRKTVVDRGDVLPDVGEDFCGAPRTGVPDLGAIEFGPGPPCRVFGAGAGP